MKMTIEEAIASKTRLKYSRDAIDALVTEVVGNYFSETEKSILRVDNIKRVIVNVFHGMTDFSIIQEILDGHPWLTRVSENVYKLQREFDEPKLNVYI